MNNDAMQKITIIRIHDGGQIERESEQCRFEKTLPHTHTSMVQHYQYIARCTNCLLLDKPFRKATRSHYNSFVFHLRQKREGGTKRLLVPSAASTVSPKCQLPTLKRAMLQCCMLFEFHRSSSKVALIAHTSFFSSLS